MTQISIGALKSPTKEELTRLSTLSVVSNYLCSDLDSESLVKTVLFNLVSAFGADRGFIQVHGPEQSILSQHFLDVSKNNCEEAFTFTKTFLENCMETKAPVLVIDTDQVAPTQSVTMTGIRSVMLSPLVVGDRLVGVIYLDSLIKAGCFEENDLKLFGLIGEMVAITVDRNLHADKVERQAVALDDAQARLDLAAEETIRRLSRAAEFRDGETSEHLTRVSEYCEVVSRQLGLDEREVSDIKIASLLHDVGKLGIPDSIMLKPGRFTDYERRVMQQHTHFGAKILANSSNPVIELAALVALRHHEKWDGSGYPDGISGEDIPLPARIVAAADVFDAVSSARRYKESYSLEDTFELLRKESGSHFDPQVVEAFLALRSEISSIWSSNQDHQEEKPEPEQPSPKETVSTELTVEKALETLESSPVVLAKESKFTDDFKGKLMASISYLADHLDESSKTKLLDLTNFLSQEGLSFQDATKLAPMVQGLRGGVSPPRPETDPSPQILVLDSDPYQREVVSTEATRRGMRVIECSSAEQAQQVIAKQAPSLVMVEIDDPGGLEFLTQQSETHPELPFLVLTRNGNLERRLKVATFDDCSFLQKPLPPAAVVDEIEEHLIRTDVDKRLKVIAFDDDKVVLTVISRVLERQGYSVFTVTEPDEFWDQLTEHNPDLVLLDLEMPTVNGFEICRILRDDVEYRHLPVVVLTAHQEIHEYQKALEAGADDVLPKPLQARRLLSRIETRLARNRALQSSGNRDPLTGLTHCRQAVKMAEPLFASALRQAAPFSVCCLEIENFEDMVEQKGWHHSADVLRQVAQILVRSNRPEDIVTRDGGNKLFLMLIGVTAQGVEQRVASLNTKLGQHKGPLGGVRCRAKSASAPADGTELKKLLAKVGFSYSLT